ncbi:protein containing DNA primase/polymerase, bifunctional, partial [mine drainage metagenome]
MTMTSLEELRAGGHFLLPIPPRSKEPPPKGWVDRREPYEIPLEGNVAIGVRGETCILITNDEQSTAWATEQFGLPNVRSVRGGHWYFRAREGRANEPNKATPVGLMEFHVRNKYALVPPSVHPSGSAYLWVRPLPPANELPEAPDLRELWNPGGEHHDKLLKMSAAKARAGKDAAAIFSELAAWRDRHLPDPQVHPDRELHQLADSAVGKFGKAVPKPRRS